ncbi:protoporphyrinogen oxidase [Microbacterium sp. STN6]|uniref:protoporphyrinogen oxidase n=1 Tax=Microbacterium sp. STN6 TaxID=2995588 RepID=UPI00226088AA|nr:protoporphyrinogen oxidase [Microbacterium sp. STN6]MCX7522659.1 protoporphyrinogen oxidase [Microbacterium sp. STN6]
MAEESEPLASTRATRVVVIGAGVAGLVAARECARVGFDVTVIEAADAAGGSVASRDVAGLRLDVGAESFATRGGSVAELLSSLGLADDIVGPNPAGAWLRLADRTVPMPKAGLLGIPGSPLASDVVRAIGWGGALRAYLDRLMPVMKIGREHNLGALVRRRMGRAVYDRLVAPVAGGVYSASPDELDIGVVAPGLNGALTRAGSLSGAVAELRGAGATGRDATGGTKPGSAVAGIDGGMWRLAEALVEDLERRGGRIRLGVAATAVRPGLAADGEGAADEQAAWLVELADGEVLPADAVLVAAPGGVSLEVLRAASATLENVAELDWPAPTSVEIVTLVLDAPALDAAPRGTGLLVAEDAHETVAAKAMTHSTAKWAWLAQRAGAGRHVLRLSYGRAGQQNVTTSMTDAELRALALRDAAALTDMPLEESMLAGFARTRWRNALPFAALGQRARIDAVRAAVDELEGIEVTGAWLTGTGLAQVVPDSIQAARRIRGLRWRALTQEADRR